jgi:hypothetical protein
MRTPFEAINCAQPMKSGFLVALSVLALAGSGLLRGAEFETDVLPLFTKSCKDCHMEGKAKGHLALDADKIAKEIGSSKAIVPGEPEKSDLLKVLKLKEDDEKRMPPKGKGSPLSEEEIGKIRTWITEGAKLPEKDSKATDKKEEPKDKADGKTEGAAALETWTSSAGSSVKASLLRMSGSNVVLKLENGRVLEVPLSKLSEESQAQAKAASEKK